MNAALSKIGKKGFARFLVFYLCLGLAAPVTPLLAKPGDITDNSGYVPFIQAFFAFEVESPLGGMKDEPTWDEIEKVLDDPYQFSIDTTFAPPAYPQGPWPTVVDNATGRQSVLPTGQFVGAGGGNNEGWPAYRRTDSRRRAVQYRLGPDNVVPCQPDELNCNEITRSFLYRVAGTDNTCAPNPNDPTCVEVPHAKLLQHPLNYNFQGGEELRLLNPLFEETTFGVPGDLMITTDFMDNTCTNFVAGPEVPNLVLPVYRYDNAVITVSAGATRLEDDEAAIDYNSPIQSDIVKYGGETCIRTLEFIFSPGPGPGMRGEFGIVQERIAEGVCLCGGDPGEPGYPDGGVPFGGFGVLGDLATMYSTPTVPGKSTPGSVPAGSGVPNTIIPADILVGGGGPGNQLFDPARGFIYARDPVTGFGMDMDNNVDPEPFDANGVYPNCDDRLQSQYPYCYATLRKPSLRIPLEGCLADNTSHLRCGSGIAPNYLWNSDNALLTRAIEEAIAEIAVDPANPTDNEIALANAEAAEEFPAFLAPSNENDYIRNRDAAAVLGKAIFWDQQLGSDSVQACASCHFHAGADNRTKNQLNPNHLSGDFTFQLKGPNQEVVPADFPFHKLATEDIAGDPACVLPLVTPLGQVVCDASNIVSDHNDVMSSMGVFFGVFGDIPPIGSFTPASNGVASVPPDIRTNTALTWRQQLEAAVTLGRTDVSGLNVGNIDPIPAFQGVRRVEPRNTPTLFLSAMNFDNFWDGRARHDFNGGSVFGASDPQSHVWVNDNVANNTLVPTRQIIRFASLASLFTGPALSNFEMSLSGRNWQKIGKKLLQPGVTPLANQLVDPTDGVLGPWSNQGGVACANLAANSPGDCSGDGTCATASQKPGLCISYPALIRRAYYPALWENQTQHLNGATSGCAKPMVLGERDPSDPPNCDPFDGYVLALANGPANPTATNQFTQMEANVTLFFGLGVQVWGSFLVADDTPMDRFFDANPDSFKAFGESGEPFLVVDLVGCNPNDGVDTGGVQSCFTEVGNFKRDSFDVNPNLRARINCSDENCTEAGGGAYVNTYGTRTAADPDPLLGLDFFLGSNLSLKNPNYRSLRCGECHSGANTDHTFGTSHQMGFIDWVTEFVTPGHELFPEPLTRGRLVHPFALEGELTENAQDAVERNMADLELDEFGFPKGMALFDNGMYNIGVRPIHEDVGRGGPDPFGWPLSLSYLALKNLGGPDYSPGGDNPDDGFALPPYPGIPLPNFEPQAWVLDNVTGLVVIFDNVVILDNMIASLSPNCGLQPGDLAPCDPPEAGCGDPIPNCNPQTGLQGDPTGGGLLFPTGQDFQINPGFAEEPADPQLPPHLAPWASNVNVGDETLIDEVFVGLNTLQREAMLEGWVDTFGPFNPAATISEVNNNARQVEMGTWPNVNRVNAQGAFKAATLHHVELTGPYFHNGGKMTLRQQLDFYDRGGDFPISNSAHRDFLITHFDIEDEALGGWIDPATGLPLLPGTQGGVPEFTEEQKEAIKVAMIDFLLELTDERVAFERAPFDHPEVIVPLDGRAPENHQGRAAMLAQTTGDCGGIAGAGPCFRVVPAVGQAGVSTRLPNFLGIESRPAATGGRCTPKPGGISAAPVNQFGGRVYADILECTGPLSHYDADTARLEPQLRPVGSTTTGAPAASAGVTASVSAPAPAPLVVARSTSITPEISGTTFNAAAAAVASVTLGTTPSGEPAAGSTITLSAAATGGSGSYEYRFWVHDGTSWSIVQDYSPAETFDWKPSKSGTYIVQVHARSAGSTAAYEAWTGIEYTVQ